MASNRPAHPPQPGAGSQRTQHLLALLCFFASGFAALVYEVAWIRKASLVFGATTFAVSSVLAVFFLGLAGGSYFAGRLSRQTSRPLRLYAFVEIGLGLLALLSPHAFDLAELLYGGVYRAMAEHTALLFLSRVLLVALVVLPPTLLMGATLPLFCRQYVTLQGRIARTIGFLYGLNTLGAALGCAVAGLLLLPALGLVHTVYLGAALSLLGGLAVWLLPIGRQEVPPPGPSVRGPATARKRAVSLLFFAVGFAALGGEVLWTRYLGLLMHNTVYTYAVTLTVVLFGIVIGSFVAARFFDGSAPRARWFGGFQVLTGLAVLFFMMLPAGIWRGLGSSMWVYHLLILPSAILSGASFPLAVRMVVEEVASASASTGRMAALNTLGGIAGSLLIGFVGLPFFGLTPSLLFVSGVSVATGCVAWLALDRSSTPVFRGAAVAVSTVVWLGLPQALGTRLPADFLGDRESLVAFREGYGSNLAILRSGDLLRLEIDRLWQGDNSKSHQILAAHIPMLLHPDPRRVLVVGTGTGQTASRFLMYDIDHLASVDIEPTIFEFVRPHFDSRWMDDERVSLVRADGRNFLMHTDASYDVISLEVGQVHRPGVAFFYTADFYQRARERLQPGGLLSQFVPLSFLTPPQLRSVLRSFLGAFPRSVLWYNTSELLLIGARDEESALRPESLERLSANPAVHRDLGTSYWGGPEHAIRRPRVYLAGFLMGPAGLAALAGQAPVYRDDRPVLDYATSRTVAAWARATSHLEELRAHLEPVSSLGWAELSAIDSLAIEEIRELNLAAIEAGDLIKRVYGLDPDADYETMIDLLEEAVAVHPQHFEARLRLAQTLMSQRRYEEARGHYAAAARINATDFPAQSGLGLALHRLGRIDESIAHFSAAVRLRSDHAETHYNLGVALGQRGYRADAARHLQQALRLRPEYGDARRALARLQSPLAPR